MHCVRQIGCLQLDTEKIDGFGASVPSPGSRENAQ